MNKEIITKLKYIFTACICIAVVALFFKFSNLREFLDDIENKTFDIRQQLIARYKKPNKDIVILAIDNSSYEYIVSEYGAWPVPRDFWAKITLGVEQAKPKMLIFDLLFVQNYKAYGNSDKALADAVNTNDNVYLSIAFDNQDPEVRVPINLPSDLKADVEGNTDALFNAPYVNYGNVRPLVKELLSGTKNIGFVNVKRDKDGIIRTMIPLFVYKNNFYRHLDLLCAMDILGINSSKLKIDEKGDILLSNKTKIPLDKTGRAYLNWYGGEFMYEYVSLWKVDKAIKNNDIEFLNNAFRNKIIFAGTTSDSMSDIKSTPLSVRYPGVETQATFLNNILDNNLINKSEIFVNVIITLFLIFIASYIIKRLKSVLYAGIAVFFILIFYLLLTLFLMHFLNLWIAIAYPVLAVILTFAISYAVKYIVTSRDYEHTYKLAVTDGLTDMYNHRYFQEQMKLNVDNSKRYNSEFSLIMIDIDFFKKFNDKYGHQSGDAVLRQVAQTIKKNIRSTDIPCRYGGEEMAVILSNTSKEDAAKVAVKICEAVRQREFELADGSWTHVTISLGVSSMPKNADSTESLIAYADKCLYIAKENGRNQVVSEAG